MESNFKDFSCIKSIVKLTPALKSRCRYYPDSMLEQENKYTLFQYGQNFLFDSHHNTKTAFHLIRKAADQGVAEAQFWMGIGCSNPSYGSLDLQKSMEWFEKAADQGHALSQYHAAYNYYFGKSVSCDYKKAFRLFETLRKNGTGDSIERYACVLYYLGCCYYDGKGTKRDIWQALGLWREAADTQFGHQWAEEHLGECYFLGKHIEQNYAEAVRLFRKASEKNTAFNQNRQGNASAQNLLGICYCNGLGVERNYSEAARYFQKAADQNLTDAMFNLAMLYKDGKGVSKNKKMAQEYLKKAADMGHKEAAKELKASEKLFWSLSVTSYFYTNAFKKNMEITS